MQEEFNKFSDKLGQVQISVAELKLQQKLSTEEDDALRDEVKELKEELKKVTTKMNRWESKFGMAMFIGTCLWAAITTFKDNIAHLLK
jgi:archaellum component FlaC